jgi:hypothetical protein
MIILQKAIYSFYEILIKIPMSRESNTLNRSEVSVNVTFLAKLSNKETYLKMAPWLGFGKSIACVIGDVLTPLNCFKV